MSVSSNGLSDHIAQPARAATLAAHKPTPHQQLIAAGFTGLALLFAAAAFLTAIS